MDWARNETDRIRIARGSASYGLSAFISEALAKKRAITTDEEIEDLDAQVIAKLTKREHLARGRSQRGGTRSHGGKVTSLPPKTGGSTDEGER